MLKDEIFENRGKIKILIFNEVERDELTKTCKYIWDIGILNVVFIEITDIFSKIILYNPFTGKLKISVVHNMDLVDEFPDELKNMNGYPLKLLIYPYFNNYDGDHIIRMSLKKYFNCSIVYQPANKYDDIPSIKRSLIDTGTDFCVQTIPMKSSLYVELDRLTTWSISSKEDHIVILVPKPKRVSGLNHIIDNILSVKSILITFITLCSVAFIDKILSTEHLDYFDNLLFFIMATIQVSPYTNSRKKSLVKAAWLLICIIIHVTNSAIILKCILSNSKDTRISTLQDLNTSEIPVFYYAGNIKEFRFKKSHRIPKNIWSDMILANRGNVALVGLLIDVKYYLSEIYETKNYEIMKELLIPCLGAHVVKRRSPYISRLDLLKVRLREFGFFSRFSTPRKEEYLDNGKISFSQLHGIFYLYFCGCILSLVVFAVEHVIYKLKQK
ncbi:hypothetical protein GWI33_008823 [Rhynchophorus ferrugineus]|uniref:Ionotropic receptor n=1 Tax=Rhynchophorus ferrugineus TaxID=354439 RepID=A0A834MAS9_RHYFE|nr:hypothetical protein GWI33_008823 [Rhynchophorus ferrugineus]